MNNNLEFENEDPSPNSIEDNHPRTNYGEGYIVKETLEEAAERYADFSNDHVPICFGDKFNPTSKADFIAGANYQAERMYSEEEVCDFVEWMNLHYRVLEHPLSFKDAKGTKELLNNLKTNTNENNNN